MKLVDPTPPHPGFGPESTAVEAMNVPRQDAASPPDAASPGSAAPASSTDKANTSHDPEDSATSAQSEQSDDFGEGLDEHSESN